MAMAKKKLMNPSHVLIFVEGDTDEVFFKALIDYYASVNSNKLLPYDVCNLKGVTRYSSKLLAKLKKIRMQYRYYYKQTQLKKKQRQKQN